LRVILAAVGSEFPIELIEHPAKADAEEFGARLDADESRWRDER